MSERYSRQEGLVPTDRLKNTRVGIAGCGAIGRQLAIQLAAMGAGSLFLADFDSVETGNLGAQGWFASDVGKRKVEALADTLLLINPEIELHYRHTRYPADSPVDVLFLCVDRMDSRRHLFEQYGDLQLIIDGRMAADTIRVLTVDQHSEADEEEIEENRNAYERTLFDDAQAFQGTCTTRSTIYMANMAAALMVRQYVSWLNGAPLASDITLGLASMELTTNL